jgi:hypothetical protein
MKKFTMRRTNENASGLNANTIICRNKDQLIIFKFLKQ